MTLEKVNNNVYDDKGTEFYIKRVNIPFERNSYSWIIYDNNGKHSDIRYETLNEAIKNV